MKIKCTYDENQKCGKCSNQHICPLLNPSSKNHTLLLNEIDWYLNELNKAKHNLIEYEMILNDIKNHKYSGVVNVYGSIKHYPKQNVFGVFIRKPEHVNYGWNYDRLVARKDKLLEHIRLLNSKELNMRKILMKDVIQ